MFKRIYIYTARELPGPSSRLDPFFIHRHRFFYRLNAGAQREHKFNFCANTPSYNRGATPRAETKALKFGVEASVRG